jgi:hypothetical protein
LNGTVRGLIDFRQPAAGGLSHARDVTAVSLVLEDGQITRVYLVRNPRKLTRLAEPADLSRSMR